MSRRETVTVWIGALRIVTHVPDLDWMVSRTVAEVAFKLFQ